MRYRRFGQTKKKVSVLGFGCMRLPTVGSDSGMTIRQPFSMQIGSNRRHAVRDDTGQIDEPQATEMLRHAIDNGVNYVDTGYFYHEGQSERFIGRALKDGYRQRVHLATKLPPGLVSTTGDFDRILDEQLERLQTKQVDFYLLHGLNQRSWPKVRDLGVLEWSERARSDGRIGHFGFSFHDTLETFKGIIDCYDGWALCQIQYNWVDADVQAGTEGLRYAADRGLAVVVMEPIRGGKLACLPQPVVEILEQLEPRRSLAALALHWVWNRPEVSVALSGMSTIQQVLENLASADASGVGSLSKHDLHIYEQARDKYHELCPIPCTECRYCLPCPNGVFIPANLAVYNQAKLLGQLKEAKRRYSWFASRDRDVSAAACIQCRECEERCPQQIPISEWMPEVDALLAED